MIAEIDQQGRHDTSLLIEERFERRLTEEFSKLRQDVTVFKSEIIKWMFLFWIGQVAVIVALFSWFLRAPIK